MEATAYWMALVTLIAVPPCILVWVIVHPFVRLWRRAGPAWTYLVVGSIVAACMVGIGYCSGPLMRVRLGVRWPLVCLAVPCFLGALYIGVRRARLLTPGIMLGLPELSQGKGPGRLLTGGIYAQIRNPRYVEVGLALAAIALFCNYLATYVLLVLYAPAIYLVVLLEERELRQRFGEEYERYCREVPRFVPRLSRRAAGSH